MEILQIEEIAAKKFVEVKGMEYLDANRYTMAKKVSNIEEENEVKFEFFIAKTRPKQPGNILVDETIHGKR